MARPFFISLCFQQPVFSATLKKLKANFLISMVMVKVLKISIVRVKRGVKQYSYMHNFYHNVTKYQWANLIQMQQLRFSSSC